MYRVGRKDKSIKVTYGQRCKDFKDNPHYKALGVHQGQQVLKSVVEACFSYNQLESPVLDGEDSSIVSTSSRLSSSLSSSLSSWSLETLGEAIYRLGLNLKLPDFDITNYPLSQELRVRSFKSE
ncbi:MAG: hypothetical protein F6K56_15505 [Moorea sp. SIO3G5]|nr:hypothetical protein [Moorena sp. SIO3G5]